LGDINIWNQSFLNVVTETVDNSFWLSEKTFKPIIGKRPFVILNEKSLAGLKEVGFKTFDKYWDENMPVIDIIKTICNMSEQKIIKIYNDMQ
jgi:hypothetical protein